VRVRARVCRVPRDQVDDYVAKICPLNDSAVLVKFKFNILKIVCDHEHYVPLNVPVSPGILSVPAIPAQFWYPALLTSSTRDTMNSHHSNRTGNRTSWRASSSTRSSLACLVTSSSAQRYAPPDPRAGSATLIVLTL
jgi:hypothetical protein